ncbi:hypothetical protein CR201_G0052856 [Pongo abelii]|uniref:Uncharacterized protein n=1 Tax=Pongo abelii TaxID=9601 RepID=A0A2J8R8T1_PONAB|nr:hypothetical protein CR201_G0052856 [Pongo abelii]
MENLKEKTHTQHYECYRYQKLQKMGFTEVGSFQEISEAKRQEFYDQCQREEEKLKQRFMQRVKEKEATLKEAKKEVSTEVGYNLH